MQLTFQSCLYSLTPVNNYRDRWRGRFENGSFMKGPSVFVLSCSENTIRPEHDGRGQCTFPCAVICSTRCCPPHHMTPRFNGTPDEHDHEQLATCVTISWRLTLMLVSTRDGVRLLLLTAARSVQLAA